MSTKPTLKDAIDLATQHHEGQFDKGGKPYIGHPMRVMEKMMLKDYKIVAVLHDIVEDTSITLQDLKDLINENLNFRLIRFYNLLCQFIS